jgi:hypothetical protein
MNRKETEITGEIKNERFEKKRRAKDGTGEEGLNRTDTEGTGGRKKKK